MGSFALRADTGQTDTMDFPVRGEGGRFVPASKPAPVAAKVATATAKPGPSDAAAALAAAVQALAAGVTPDDLAGLRDDLMGIAARVEELESRKPARIEFKVGEVVGKVIEGARPELEKIVGRIAMGFKNIYLAGPAGSGKSTLGQTIADALGRPFGEQSVNGETSTRKLLGGLSPNGSWVEPEFVRIYESGGVFLIDEVDAGDPNILLVINSALANGRLNVPDHPDPSRRSIKRHPDTVIVCAANTWGTGPDSQYCGRVQLDAAFLNRFCGAKFFIGYDRALEESLCEDRAMLSALWTIREKIATHRVRRILGTRDVIAAAMMRAGGMRQSEIIAELSIEWTSEEKGKVL